MGGKEVHPTSLPSVLWHCWLGHLTRKNPSPYDLYCVGGTLSLTQSISQPDDILAQFLWLCSFGLCLIDGWGIGDTHHVMGLYGTGAVFTFLCCYCVCNGACSMESRGAMEKVMTAMMLRARHRASVLKAECGRMEVVLRQRYYNSTDWFNRHRSSVGIVLVHLQLSLLNCFIFV